MMDMDYIVAFVGGIVLMTMAGAFAILVETCYGIYKIWTRR